MSGRAWLARIWRRLFSSGRKDVEKSPAQSDIDVEVEPLAGLRLASTPAPPRESLDVDPPPPSTSASLLPLGSVEATLLHYLDGCYIKRHSVDPWNTTGGFCDVFTGDHPTFHKVAMKRPRISGEGCSPTQLRSFTQEAQIWKKLHHPNVLQFVGMILSDSRVWLVSIFAENGTLPEYLVKHPEADRQNLVFQFTRGLNYLHSKNVVHGDLKGSNLLISIDGELLIGDFGLSKLIDKGTATDSLKKGAGSIHWMAPELLNDDDSTKTFWTDVYAFGICISEILRGELPFKQYTNFFSLVKAISMNERPPTLPRESPQGQSYAPLWAVAEACWDAEPDKRPSMLDVCKRLLVDSTEEDNSVIVSAALPANENNQESGLDAMNGILPRIHEVDPKPLVVSQVVNVPRDRRRLFSTSVARSLASRAARIAGGLRLPFRTGRALLTRWKSSRRTDQEEKNGPKAPRFSATNGIAGNVPNYYFEDPHLSAAGVWGTNDGLEIAPANQTIYSIPQPSAWTLPPYNGDDIRLLQPLGDAEYRNIGHTTDDGLSLDRTLVDIRENLDAWADNGSSPNVMLLRGQAGGGKPTIARNIVPRSPRRSGDSASPAIFRFRRGNDAMNRRTLLPPTRQLGGTGGAGSPPTASRSPPDRRTRPSGYMMPILRNKMGSRPSVMTPPVSPPPPTTRLSPLGRATRSPGSRTPIQATKIGRPSSAMTPPASPSPLAARVSPLGHVTRPFGRGASIKGNSRGGGAALAMTSPASRPSPMARLSPLGRATRPPGYGMSIQGNKIGSPSSAVTSPASPSPPTTRVSPLGRGTRRFGQGMLRRGGSRGESPAMAMASPTSPSTPMARLSPLGRATRPSGSGTGIQTNKRGSRSLIMTSPASPSPPTALLPPPVRKTRPSGYMMPILRNKIGNRSLATTSPASPSPPTARPSPLGRVTRPFGQRMSTWGNGRESSALAATPPALPSLPKARLSPLGRVTRPSSNGMSIQGNKMGSPSSVMRSPASPSSSMARLSPLGRVSRPFGQGTSIRGNSRGSAAPAMTLPASPSSPMARLSPVGRVTMPSGYRTAIPHDRTEKPSLTSPPPASRSPPKAKARPMHRNKVSIKPLGGL